MKACTKCHEVKQLTEFPKDRSKADGLQSNCKECKRKYNRSYYAENPDYFRQWHSENPDYFRRWYQDNREERCEYNRQWYADNPMAHRLENGRHRARANNLPAEVFSFAELEAYWETIGVSVEVDAYTGVPIPEGQLEFDHVEPLSLPGSAGHTMQNLRPVTKSTNRAKRDKPLADYQKGLAHA